MNLGFNELLGRWSGESDNRYKEGTGGANSKEKGKSLGYVRALELKSVLVFLRLEPYKIFRRRRSLRRMGSSKQRHRPTLTC